MGAYDISPAFAVAAFALICLGAWLIDCRAAERINRPSPWRAFIRRFTQEHEG
jgi:hypothetical protein